MKLSSTGVCCNQVLTYFMADIIMHPLKYQLVSHNRFREEQGHQTELAPPQPQRITKGLHSVCPSYRIVVTNTHAVTNDMALHGLDPREHPANSLSFIFRSGGICILSALSRRSQPAKCQYHTIFHHKLWIVWFYIFCCQSSSNGMCLLSPAVTLTHTYWNICRKNLLLLTLHHSSWSSPAPRARGCLFRKCLKKDVIPSPRFSKQQ